MVATTRRISMLCAAAAGSVMVAMAMAAPAATDQSAQGGDQSVPLTEIIVTAQFRKENIQDMPIAMTAVSSAMMEARCQTSLAMSPSRRPTSSWCNRWCVWSWHDRVHPRHRPGRLRSGIRPRRRHLHRRVYYTSLTGSDFALLDQPGGNSARSPGHAVRRQFRRRIHQALLRETKGRRFGLRESAIRAKESHRHRGHGGLGPHPGAVCFCVFPACRVTRTDTHALRLRLPVPSSGRSGQRRLQPGLRGRQGRGHGLPRWPPRAALAGERQLRGEFDR